MYERFTDRARKVMQLANQEAQRFNHEYIGTEHILLGLVKEGSGVAANVLLNLGVDLPKIRREVEKVVRYGATDTYPTGRLPQTPPAKMVIEFALEEARTLNHNYVGTEHLLLGLLREKEGVAAVVLTNLGLELEGVREEVLNLLGHNMPEAGASRGVPLADVVDDTPTLWLEGEEPYPVTPPAPLPIAEGHLDLLRALLRRLTDEKEAAVAEEDFPRAARLRDEADALKRLLAWYEWHRTQQ